MDAFRLILRADLRRGWRPMLMLALLLGVTGGVVLTAATGAERTSTAYPRLLEWAHASQLDLVSDADTPAAFYRQLRALPGVASVARASYYDTPGLHRHARGPRRQLRGPGRGPAAARRLPAPQSGCPARFTCYNFMLARYQAGTGMAAAATRLDETIARLCPPEACTVTADQRPGEIRHYTSVRDTPAVLGALLALLAAGTLSHVLLTSVRRRRRDFAVLRVLGLVRAQVLAVVTWQGLTVTVIALLAGVPAGLLAGRWAWVLFAGEAGVQPGATIPVPLVLLSIPATLALGAALAVWPGHAAVRAGPAAALREE